MLFLLQALMCWNDSLGYNTLLKAVTSIPLIYFVNMCMVQRLEHSLLGLVLSFHLWGSVDQTQVVRLVTEVPPWSHTAPSCGWDSGVLVNLHVNTASVETLEGCL